MRFKARQRKVLVVASEGGHWVQLMRLKPAFDKYQTVYASTNIGLKDAYELKKFILIRDANLTKKVALFISAFETLLLVWKIRPTHVISTGAAPGFLCVAWGKIFGAKTIWLDSIANAEEMSAAGRKAKYFSDLWLTQWPELATKDGPAYAGRVI